MSRKLRIAEFVTSEVPFPIPKSFPRPYAPLTVALDIAQGLHDRGHEVLFFGPKGSKSKSFKAMATGCPPMYSNKILSGNFVRDLEREKLFSIHDQYIISKIFEEHQRKAFDIIHIHPVDRILPFAGLFKTTPIVSTLHDPMFDWRSEILSLFGHKNLHLVSISDAQRKPSPRQNYAATIYNGIDTSIYPFEKQTGDYLFFSGRIQEKKGVHEAILAAKKTKQKLLIAGSTAKDEYWKDKVEPYLGKNIQYVGFIAGKTLLEYYKNAKAVLVPIRWEEPFGLVMIEAMACGTPVIAFNRGSASEIIQDKKTGFVVKTMAQMCAAIPKIPDINRGACRRLVESKFSLKQMTDGYERLFQKLSKNRV